MEVRLWSYKLFLEAPKVFVTYEDVVRLYRISVEKAQEYLRRDLEEGLILGEYPEYSLTDLGYEMLFQHIRRGGHGGAL